MVAARTTSTATAGARIRIARTPRTAGGTTRRPTRTTARSGNPGEDKILNLTLAPIDLNLLGLRVRTSRIDLRIEAIPGGGLLGDLLCGITNLLNPAAGTPLATITQLLNALLALVPTGPASATRVT